MALNRNSIYTNEGNPVVLDFLDETSLRILDVGCGAGDTGELIRSIRPTTYIAGIAVSQAECELAERKLDRCVCLDIEHDSLSMFSAREFDVLILLHVLEHLVDPVNAIRKLLPYLKIGGKVIIALPNVANWRNRWKLALGQFEYTEQGIMDHTHLHFYTYYTAPKYLVDPIPELKLKHHGVNGNIPLAFLRHHILSDALRNKLDAAGSRWMPNLFGGEIVIVASYTP